MELLSKDHSILERTFMECRPFGVDERGEMIRDISGISVLAMVHYMQSFVAQTKGLRRSEQVTKELCERLNAHIRDRAYHVTPAFLKNTWNSYSYEFVVYVYELCERLSGDPQFAFNAGKEKISPIIQTLSRPFSLSQIYRMYPYFIRKYSVGAIENEMGAVSESSVTLRFRFTERSYRQFGPYRKRCAFIICQSHHGSHTTIPERVHHLPPAVVRDVSCMVNGDEWCELEISWVPQKRRGFIPIAFDLLFGSGTGPIPARDVPPALLQKSSPGTAAPAKPDEPPLLSKDHTILYRPLVEFHPFGLNLDGTKVRPAAVWPVWAMLAGGAAFAYLQLTHPALGLLESLAVGFLPPAVAWLATRHRLQREALMREALIHEQVEFVESRHEELREAYLEQEQTHVELRRRVNQLTTMHRTGLLFSSTLDRETLVQSVLATIVRELGYDRAMISFYDRVRRVTYDARVLGVSKEAAALAYSHEIPVHDPATLEGEVLLQGKPVLIPDLRQVWERLHPLNRELAIATQAKALISVPLKVNDMVIGALSVDRIQEHSLTSDDLELMVTLASQVAIALDNTEAYRQIEALNLGLEAKVRERTIELERADRLRSLFLSHVSHELRTPLTCIKGCVENLLGGLAGPLGEKQLTYLDRIGVNVARLIRMITELLDQSRIESGKLDILPAEVDLRKCVSDVIEQLRPLAVSKGQQLEQALPPEGLMVWADADRVVQILTNLLQNAIKFTPDGGRIAVRVGSDSQNFARISVADTGPGIPPEAVPRIFDPFFRVGHEQRGSHKGLGLGLSIAKTLVDLHGGTITVKSEPEKGCEFVFTLPYSPAWKARQSHALMAAKQILVVDDDADIRQLLLDWLKSQGFSVATAVSGSHALLTLKTGRFDGVILDMGLPDLDGLEVLRRLRESDPTIPVLVVTASGSKERAVQAVSAGAQAYLLKPFDLGHMEELADYWFRPA